MSEPFVEVTRTEAAAVITFRREAKLNALSTAVEAQLGEALDHPDVRRRPSSSSPAGRARSPPAPT